MLRGRRDLVLLLMAFALLPTAAASAKVGAVTQLHGKGGCVARQNDTGAVRKACTVARFAGVEMDGVAVSPDGRNLYVTSIGGALAVFRIHHGRLRELAGRAACFSATGSSGCTRVPQLSHSGQVTVSPDGRTVYVGAANRKAVFGGVVIFARARKTGALHKVGCVGENAAGGCIKARSLLTSVDGLTVSPDGRSIYVGSNSADPGGAHSGAVAVFARARNGKLSQLPGAAGCLNADGSGGCTVARELLPQCCDIAISPNSRNVYLSSSRIQTGAFGLAAFSRNTASGALSQLTGTAGCLNADGTGGCTTVGFKGAAPDSRAGAVLISPNGRDVYLAHASSFGEAASCGGADNFVALFGRDRTSGALGPIAQDRATCGSAALISRDGRSVYASSGDFGSVVSAFSRDRRSGLLAGAGCIGHDAPGCRPTRHVSAPDAIAMTPGGSYVYVVSNDPVEGSTIGVFRRSRR
jgi:DNA-binding beta-propeller fold protein YncE